MNEESLFHEALARPPGERDAFLKAACAGDPRLRSAVEKLLQAHEASGNILGGVEETIDRTTPTEQIGSGNPPGASAPVATTPTVTGSSTFEPRGALEADSLIAGRYILQERLGQGGMGEVWTARQTSPVKRLVALKLIKPGMDSRAVLQRFELERQALAVMDHPNIAKVLDAGMTPNGQPFFAMELVDGLPLTEFCDQAKLTPRDRLALFVPICQAIQHAHQKGIVHRDLKPANILVTLVDGKPMPKVIDFGVAKATAGKLTDESLSTQFGAVVGTLEYMSPEQAMFSGDDIDTRADIYSLGVVLYELLTGLRPFDTQRLKKAALSEMIRIIREEEPSKPSTRLSTHDSLPSMAALRQIEPRRLMTMLRGELDWVVMKCLEKHRDRRYETANGLARDIQRYLADEPVEARPPSTSYRIAKLLRRNKGPALAAAAILLLLIAGIVSTSWQARVAQRARDLARSNEQRAVRAADAERRAKNAEIEHRTKAEAAERRASAEAATAKAVSDFLQSDVLLQADVRHQLQKGDAVKGGLTIRDALDRSAARIGDRFEGQRLAEASIRQAIARSYVSLGESKLALPHQQRAYELFKASIGDDDPRTIEAKSNLAECIAVAGDASKVLGMRKEVAERYAKVLGPSDPRSIEAHQAVAIQLLSAGRLPEAIEIYEALLPAIENAPSQKDDLLISTRAGLAAGYSRAGRFREALPLLEEVYRWFAANRPADDPDIYHALNSLAFCYYNMGRPGEALPLHERCLRQRREKYGASHPDTIQSLNNMALVLMRLGRKQEAIRLQEEACGYKKAQSGPESPQFLSLQTNLALMYMDGGKLSQAIEMLEDTYRLFKSTLGPGDISSTRAANGLGSAYTKAGRFADAVQVLSDGLDPWNSKPGDVPFAVQQAKTNLGLALVESGSPEKAVALLTDSLSRAVSTLGEDNPITVHMRIALSIALREVGRLDEAIRNLESARAVSGALDLCDVIGELATTRERAGDLASGLELRRAALAEALKNRAADDNHLAAERARLGESLIRSRNPAEAEPLLRAALAARRNEEPDAWTTFATMCSLGTALLDQKNYAEAEPLLRAGHEGMKLRSDVIPAQGKPQLTDALLSLSTLCEAIGKSDEAVRFRKEREALLGLRNTLGNKHP